MGLYDVRTEIQTAISANFATHLATVATLKGVSLDTSFTLYPFERVDTFHAKSLPGVGVWIRSAAVGAKRQTRRDWNVVVGIDYGYRGPSRTGVGQQLELALDAMMRVIDGLAGTGTIQGAGEEEFATVAVHDLDELLQEGGGVSVGSPIAGAFRVEVPINQQDTGL